MGRYVITGGNSGIGLEIGRQLGAKGHAVTLIGRDAAKCEAARASIPGSEALPGDLSTHQGVRDAASKLTGEFDGVIHCAGHLTFKDRRTADGLGVVFAVNYLSRYHLTQLLLPRVKRVVIIVAGVPLDAKPDPVSPKPGLAAVQICNHHYAQHLAAKVPVALCNVGLVKTEIMRDTPLPMRLGFKVLVPLLGVSVQTAAANPLQLATTDGWPSGAYWPKPGRFDVSQKMAFAAAEVERVVARSRELTGV